MKYDIYLVGVGGQGILTIGEILAKAALVRGLAVNFFPSKGMAQRGGFVKAQLRLGSEQVGPNLPERSANLAIAMELSEALKAVRFVRPGGDFALYADIWQPTAVMLAKAAYPTEETVRNLVSEAGLRLTWLHPSMLFQQEDVHLAPNLFVLGATLRHTGLREIFTLTEVEQVISERWRRAAAANLSALHAGWSINLVAEKSRLVEAPP